MVVPCRVLVALGGDESERRLRNIILAAHFEQQLFKSFAGGSVMARRAAKLVFKLVEVLVTFGRHQSTTVRR